MKQVTEGDIPAGNLAVRVSESRRKLWGLDAPATTRTANIDLAKLSTEQLERLAKGEDIYAILADTGTSGT